MAVSARPDAGARRWVVLRRVALVSWLAFGAVLWNVVFDWFVIDGGRDYLTRENRHRSGSGPGVTIHGVMDDAVARGARTATAAGGGAAGVGLGLVWAAGRRRRRALAAGCE